MKLTMEGISEELAEGNFSDPRLGKRLGLLARSVGVDPERSFPKLMSSAELEGAYRFFGNPRVTPEIVLSGHFGATRERCAKEPSVLVIHDSTTFNFRPDGDRDGLGRLVKAGQAFFGHASLVLTDDNMRQPLGLAGLHTWVRPMGKRVAGTRIEQRRWSDAVTASAARLQGSSLIHVMDREADDYVQLAHLRDGGHRFIVRSSHDRLLLEQDATARKMGDALLTMELSVERDATLTKRTDARPPVQKRIHPSRAARIAKLFVGAMSLNIRKPRPHPRDSAEKKTMSLPESLALNVVKVWEPNPPAGEAPIEWVLLTSEPIDTAEQVLRTVDRYRARWTIEEYFKAIKSGCRFESRQLGDYEALVNALALFAPIACVLLHMRSESRRVPDASALTVVTQDQIEVLRVLGRHPIADSPTVQEITLAIAILGGYIKYSKSPPGWLTLARGYTELLTLTRGWVAAKLHPACDQR